MSKKVLIVDDSATMRQQTRTLLTTNGYEVIEAVNGQLGLEQAQKTQVGLVIADVNMPVMNGLEMIGKIRQLEAYRKTPIFVLSTEASASAMNQGKAVGATAWIVKPFDPQILLGALKKFLP